MAKVTIEIVGWVDSKKGAITPGLLLLEPKAVKYLKNALEQLALFEDTEEKKEILEAIENMGYEQVGSRHSTWRIVRQTVEHDRDNGMTYESRHHD